MPDSEEDQQGSENQSQNVSDSDEGESHEKERSVGTVAVAEI